MSPETWQIIGGVGALLAGFAAGAGLRPVLERTFGKTQPPKGRAPYDKIDAEIDRRLRERE